MKKFFINIFFVLLIVLMNFDTINAQPGNLCFFGGITEGKKLPKTTELLIKGNSDKKNTPITMNYKEVLFFEGTPQQFYGTITIKNNGKIDETKNFGTYRTSYDMKLNDISNFQNSLSRKLAFDVNYRIESNQIIKNFSINSWEEQIQLGDLVYKLDPKQSYLNISTLEENKTGVSYYKGNISKKSSYIGSENQNILLESYGDIYGYDSVWSSTETHKINNILSTDDFQMQYELRPSVTVNKILQYSPNQVDFVSFNGNYREVMQNKSALHYNILLKPQNLYYLDTEGKLDIPSYNDFEQLLAPELDHLKGHPAEEDIKKLFSMKILDGDTSHFNPNHQITRGEFVSALTKAIKLPINNLKNKNRRAKEDIIIFQDVTEERVEYPFIMAAFEKRIAVGKDNGNFYIDEPLQRQEAISLIMRTLGINSTGFDKMPTSSFVDHNTISDFAKNDIYLANRFDIISSDKDGKINPSEYISKAEGACLLIKLIDYLRYELPIIYHENIINYTS